MDHGNGSETTHFQMVKRMDYNYIYVWIPICITHYYIYIYFLGDDENSWFYHISDEKPGEGLELWLGAQERFLVV